MTPNSNTTLRLDAGSPLPVPVAAWPEAVGADLCGPVALVAGAPELRRDGAADRFVYTDEELLLAMALAETKEARVAEWVRRLEAIAGERSE
jgi:hypothetical protein